MDRERAWVIPAIAGVVMLAAAFLSLGGFAGIARSPGYSIVSLTLMLAIYAPILWFTYRRNRRDPIITPVESVQPDVFGPPVIEGESVEFVGSRWKIFGWTIYFVAVFGFLLDLGLREQGACRVVSLTLVAPSTLWGLATLLACLVTPERLLLARDGLTHAWLWRTRRWGWDEVRDIRMVNSNLPFMGRFLGRRPVTSIYFRKYQPPGKARGYARVAFRSIYRADGHEVATALEAARVEWSTSAAETFVPVRAAWWTYVRTACVLSAMCALLWILFTHPCTF